MTFLDGCRDVILSPAEFNEGSGTARLYESSRFFFTSSEADLDNCGPITYRLIDKLTGDELVSPEFALNFGGNIPYVEVFPTSKDYVVNSPYEVVIDATLGIYASVESEPLELVIVDPCESTALLPEDIPQLSALIGASEATTYPVPIFKDSISAELGNGSGAGLCGA